LDDLYVILDAFLQSLLLDVAILLRVLGLQYTIAAITPMMRVVPFYRLLIQLILDDVAHLLLLYFLVKLQFLGPIGSHQEQIGMQERKYADC
jgi:hypothetical protein